MSRIGRCIEICSIDEDSTGCSSSPTLVSNYSISFSLLFFFSFAGRDIAIISTR